MLFPASTGLGVAELVMDRSAAVAEPTVIWAVAVLFARFGSLVPEVASIVFVITVPTAVPTLTLTTSVNAPVAALATSGLVQLTLPVPLTAGVVQVQPAGIARDWNVVLAGTASLNTAFTASRGALLVTVCVYVMLAPARTGFGVPA